MVQIPLLRHIPQFKEGGMTSTEPKRAFPFRLTLTLLDSGRVLSVPLTECLLVGRETLPAPDIDLSALDGVKYGISRHHAAFLYDGRTLSIEDLNSRNGTRINGFSIDGGKAYPLRNGDELELGHLRMTVQLVRTPY